MEEEKKEQEVIKENENVSTSATKKKKSKLPVIIIALVVVLVALLAGAYFFTDLFKSPKQLFEKYLFNKQHFSKVLDEENEMLERMKKDSYEATTKISVDLGNEEWDKAIKEASAIDIKDVAIVTNVKEDVKNNKSQTNLKLNYQNKKVIEANVVLNENTMALQVPDIYSKYLTIENNNLQDIAKKFGVNAKEIGLPNKILTDKDFENALTIKKEDIEKIGKKYKKVILNNIDSKDVEVDKDASVKVNVNGEEKTLDAKKYTLEINEKEALEMVIDVLKELKDDKDTLKLLEENWSAIVKLYEDNGYAIEADEFDADEVKDALEELIEDLEKDLEKYEEKKSSDLDKAKISAYVHKGETIKTALEIEEMEIAFVTYGKDDEEVVDIAMINGDEKMGINVYDKTTKSGDKVNSDAVLTVYADLKDLTDKINIKVNVNQELEFKKVDIAGLDSSNSINVNNASKAELESIGEDIVAGAMSYGLKLYVDFKDVAEKLQEFATDTNSSNEVNTNTNLEFNENALNTITPNDLTSNTLNTLNTIDLENVTL